MRGRRWILLSKSGEVCEELPDTRDDVRDIVISWIELFTQEAPFSLIETSEDTCPRS